MKYKILLLILFCSIGGSAQKLNSAYDSTLAAKYKADDYGMKEYVFVILKTGSAREDDKIVKDSLFAGHMQNIRRLVSLNKLIVAGPFLKGDNNFRGLFILDVTTFEEARLLLEKDPAIKANLLAPELYHWYGSAALPAYLETSDKIWKYNP